MYSRLPVWAPSAVADPLFREVPKAVTIDEIDAIVAGYAMVAEHCAEGGFDGIELQCSHSSIVRGFLSPATNERTDAYGGSLENRARIMIEIVAAVRRVIGTRLALGVRICGDELIDHGTTIDDAVSVAQMVEATGQVDYVNTSIGVATASLFVIEASMHIPPGYAMYIPSAIRKAIDLPVVGVGRFKDPLQAERALAEGHCDLVGVVRGQIADAEFAAKAPGGRNRRDPALPVVQPGMRRKDGAQPLVGVHREPTHRARGCSSPRRGQRRRRRPCASRCSSRVPDRPDSRPRSPPPATDIGSPCARRARRPAVRSGSRRRCRTVPSSAT